MRRYFPALVVALVCLVWLLPGLWGRVPWKPDEAYTIAIIHHFYRSGDWLVPILGGQPFMEKPPLFFWTGAVFAQVFSFVMPFVDAVRLATLFYVGVTLIFEWLTARMLYARSTARLAPLVLIGCLGFLYRGHELLTDMGLLAGFAVALYGMALCLRRPLAGGILLGIGTGIGFMCKGLIAPGVLGLIFLVLPLVIKEYRRRHWWLTAVAALLAGLPWLLIWPSALYLRSPALFHDWFWINNWGRFLGWNHRGGFNGPLYYPKDLLWITFPALPLGLYALWRARASWRAPPIALPLLATLVTFFILEISSGRDDVYTLPLLLPLSMLGAAGVADLPRPGARCMRVTGWLLFGAIGAFLWCAWLATLSGRPAFLLAYLDRWIPGNSVDVQVLPLILAVCYTAAWLWIGLRASLAGEPTLLHWVMGTALVWCLAMTLWLPTLNAAKSYASVMAEMAKAFPLNYNCLASWGVGDSERGMLSYYEDIDSQPFYTKSSQPDCQLLLVQSPPGNRHDFPAWKPIWNGARPHDHSEHFWLMERAEPPLNLPLARSPADPYVGGHRPHRFHPLGSPYHGNQFHTGNPF
ncbi:MAG TPA: glycosyltransferase family 39 protein [Gammaproteobacteria bacterium]|nr:glycosyltransferase family 39 protein [Gammaproteobacteria bacterium]